MRSLRRGTWHRYRVPRRPGADASEEASLSPFFFFEPATRTSTWEDPRGTHHGTERNRDSRVVVRDPPAKPDVVRATRICVEATPGNARSTVIVDTDMKKGGAANKTWLEWVCVETDAGVPFWHHVERSVSHWRLPEDLKNYFRAEDGQVRTEEWESVLKIDEDDPRAYVLLLKPRRSSESGELEAAETAATAQGERESVEDGLADDEAFMEMLVESEIEAGDLWESSVALLVHDPRFKRVADDSLRRELFEAFVAELASRDPTATTARSSLLHGRHSEVSVSASQHLTPDELLERARQAIERRTKRPGAPRLSHKLTLREFESIFSSELSTITPQQAEILYESFIGPLREAFRSEKNKERLQATSVLTSMLHEVVVPLLRSQLQQCAAAGVSGGSTVARVSALANELLEQQASFQSAVGAKLPRRDIAQAIDGVIKDSIELLREASFSQQRDERDFHQPRKRGHSPQEQPRRFSDPASRESKRSRTDYYRFHSTRDRHDDEDRERTKYDSRPSIRRSASQERKIQKHDEAVEDFVNTLLPSLVAAGALEARPVGEAPIRYDECADAIRHHELYDKIADVLGRTERRELFAEFVSDNNSAGAGTSSEGRQRLSLRRVLMTLLRGLLREAIADKIIYAGMSTDAAERALEALDDRRWSALKSIADERRAVVQMLLA